MWNRKNIKANGTLMLKCGGMSKSVLKDEMFSFRMNPINIDVDVTFTDNSPRYLAPTKRMGLQDHFIKFDNALKLAKEIVLSQNDRYFVVLSGNFIFGDFIESFIMGKKLKVKELTIATLSLGKENIDSLANLLHWKAVDKINLLVSDYFYAHNKETAIPYIYKELDFDEQLEFAVAGTHCKVTLIETHCGKKIIFHGSANLRSSSNIEQLVVEVSDELFDFNYSYLSNIFAEYSLINKSLRRKKLWQAITKE
jgi:hypothetical protein